MRHEGFTYQPNSSGRGRPINPDPCTAVWHDPTPYRYRQGCRCPWTRAAWSAYRNDYMRRRAQPGYQGCPPKAPTPPEELAARRSAAFERNRALAIGAQRRMRALMRRGHSIAEQAREAGISEKRIREITGDSDSGGIWPNTAECIDSMYQRRRQLDGGNERTRAYAEREEYHPPQAWALDDLDNPEAGPTWPPYDIEDSGSATA